MAHGHGLRIQMSVVAAALAFATLTLFAGQREQAVSRGQTFFERTIDGEMGGGVAGDVEGPDAPPLALSRVLLPRAGGAPSTTAPPYLFYPQAGTLWQDLFVSNFVDLGDGLTPRDYECTGYTYLGHNGHDSVIAGFREQALGVPIFAALDGTVTATHDGEFDEETTNLVGRIGNSVTMSHASGYQTYYVHFKRGSIAVSAGQVITAGTQLGLTGSSGNSSWPHLHFSSYSGGVAYEPNSGACRPGQTYWASQTAIRRDTHVMTWTFGNASFNGSAGYPDDQVTRTGSYVLGTSTVYFRMMLGTLPAQATYRVVILKPDGTVAGDSSGPFSNTTVYRFPWYWFSRNVSLNTAGTWTIDFYVNSTKVASAPFSVVSSASQIVNRAPLAVGSVALDPASPTTSDVPFCRVTPTVLYRRDPDYDLVRYQYRWDINGTVVRDVTTAGLSDALRKGLLSGADRLTCTVTPFDESTSGPSASASNVTTGPALPSPPTNLTATATGTSVTLTWTAPAGAVTAYVIEAGSAPGLADLANFSTGTTATTFSATGVGAGTYYVRVRAVSAAGTGAASTDAALVVGGSGCTAAPGAPTGLSILSNSGGTLVLSWGGATGNPTSYVIEAGSAPGLADLANSDLGGTATSFTATSVPAGTYYVRVRGRSACGTGGASNEVVVIVP